MKWKTGLKRFLAAAVSGVMLCMAGGILPGGVPDVAAPITAEASTNGHTADEAIAWCESNVENSLYNGECVGLIVEYYKYLGQAMVTGHAKHYATNALPSGWQRIQGATPQKGDILVYTDGEYGHVAIYASETLTYHQNYRSIRKVQRVSSSEWYWNRSGYWGVIRPDFTQNQKPIGWLDKVEGGDGQLYVKGWAFDPDEPTKQLMVHIYVGGGLGSDASSHAILANTERQDVDDVYHCGAFHGFEGVIYPPESGELKIYAYAIDTQGGNNPELSGCPLTATITADKEDPTISNVEVTDISSTGYTVTCDVSDNIGIQKVEFPTWSNDGGQDDLIWHKGTVKDGKATFRLDTKDHKKQTGKYITHIYAYDYAGHSVCEKLDAVLVPNPVTDIRVTNIDKTGYTVTCNIDEAWGAVKIQFPTWTDKDAQDDLIWHDGTIKDGKASYRVKSSDHNNEPGIYITHIYVYDSTGNPCSIAVPGVNVNNLGDINANGTVNTVDLVLLQKWIHKDPLTELTDPDAADLNGDGVIDVFDLALLKRKLLQKK